MIKIFTPHASCSSHTNHSFALVSPLWDVRGWLELVVAVEDRSDGLGYNLAKESAGLVPNFSGNISWVFSKSTLRQDSFKYLVNDYRVCAMCQVAFQVLGILQGRKHNFSTLSVCMELIF